MSVLFVLWLWLMGAIACGVIAKGKGRSGAGWFLLSLVIGFLFPLIMIACLPAKVALPAPTPADDHLSRLAKLGPISREVR